MDLKSVFQTFRNRPMQCCFTDLIATEAMTTSIVEVTLTVLKTFRGFVYSFTKINQ